MFVTIITIILLTLAFILWAIIYGGSRNISDKEQEFVNKEEPFTFSKIKLKIISTEKYKIFDFVYKQFEDENLRRS